MFDWDGAARAHAAAQERAWDEQMYANHEEWLQNSWGGWAVRTIRGFADNSFFRAIADSLNGQDREQTATSIMLSNGARLAIILAMILLTLAAGYVMQLILWAKTLWWSRRSSLRRKFEKVARTMAGKKMKRMPKRTI